MQMIFAHEENGEMKQMRWISIKDELPKTEELVIVTVTDDSGDTSYTYSCAGWYTGYDNLWVVDNDSCRWVTHWMQIPDISDAEPVVRCEDCKYWCYDNFNDEGEITDAWCGRPYVGFMNMTPDDFCSRGEKK